MNLNELMQSPLGRAHRRLHNVWLHDLTDRLRLRRQSIARADGLDPNDVEHYPVRGDVTIVNAGAGLAKAALVSAVLLCGGGAAGLAGAAALGWFDRPRQPAAAQPAPQQFKVTFWAEDGSEIDVEDGSKQSRDGNQE